ncbi:MAG: hypothetical protein A4E62_00517 [Syntrophorhabdus sp. PtaU1.Bin002]|nr:MAG: hypothetical protein A4E58_01447 [Syntrophorhabdus sp. PtaB.Bin006]OPY73392.1 MAG: hypothetical protein A4E62_00517 [Syntrophorhabdus sp. PtaU1.Bin002]
MKMNKLSTSFFPNSHKRIGEFGLGGYRHRSNVSDVDELQVLADRRRTERTSEGAGRSRSPQMDIANMPVTGHEKISNKTMYVNKDKNNKRV